MLILYDIRVNLRIGEFVVGEFEKFMVWVNLKAYS